MNSDSDRQVTPTPPVNGMGSVAVAQPVARCLLRDTSPRCAVQDEPMHHCPFQCPSSAPDKHSVSRGTTGHRHQTLPQNRWYKDNSSLAALPSDSIRHTQKLTIDGVSESYRLTENRAGSNDGKGLRSVSLANLWLTIAPLLTNLWLTIAPPLTNLWRSLRATSP